MKPPIASIILHTQTMPLYFGVKARQRSLKYQLTWAAEQKLTNSASPALTPILKVRIKKKLSGKFVLGIIVIDTDFPKISTDWHQFSCQFRGTPHRM